MKLRIVSSKDEINALKDDESAVHLAFRPDNKDILTLVRKCPQVKVIQVPKSYARTISSFIRSFLKEEKKIDLVTGTVWGHRKDIDEYCRAPVRGEIFDIPGEADPVRVKLVTTNKVFTESGATFDKKQFTRNYC